MVMERSCARFFAVNTKIFISVILCSASVALADDFRLINGREYKDATVSRVEPDGIVLRTNAGIAKVYFIEDRKSTRLNSSHRCSSYAVFCLTTKLQPDLAPVGRAHHVAIGQDVPVGRDDDAAAGAVHLRHPASPPGTRGPPGPAHADHGRPD